MKGNSRGLEFYLLTLSLKKIKLFKVSRSRTEELTLSGVPESLKEAIGKDEFEKQLQSHSSTGMSNKGGGKFFHGHGVGTEHHKNNIFHFFREIDNRLNKLLADVKLPLVVAGVDYLLPIYKKASRYPNLMGKGIIGNPEKTGLNELKKRSLPLVASYYLRSGL